MFNEYIDVLVNCSKDIVKKMAGVDIVDIKIKKEKSLSIKYVVAYSIQYEDVENKLKGDFILGFSDESEALSIASAVAEKMGLRPIDQFDDMASDIINEFLNTMVGHTITEWDKKGLSVRFGTPNEIKQKELNISDAPNIEAFLISLYPDPNLKIADYEARTLKLMITFTKTVDSKLLGKRILVVEDSGVLRKVISKTLEAAGFEIEQAEDGLDAVGKHKNFQPDLTMMDLVMPEMGGLDAIMEIQETNPEARFVVFTSTSRRDEEVTAKSLNVLSYLIKPLEMDELLGKVQEAFEQINKLESGD
jgi:CheY-like chemotaxis protein